MARRGLAALRRILTGDGACRVSTQPPRRWLLCAAAVAGQQTLLVHLPSGPGRECRQPGRSDHHPQRLPVAGASGPRSGDQDLPPSGGCHGLSGGPRRLGGLGLERRRPDQRFPGGVRPRALPPFHPPRPADLSPADRRPYNPLLGQHLGGDLKVLYESPRLSLPVLSLRSAVFGADLRSVLNRVLGGIAADPQAAPALAELGIDGFATVPDRAALGEEASAPSKAPSAVRRSEDRDLHEIVFWPGCAVRGGDLPAPICLLS